MVGILLPSWGWGNGYYLLGSCNYDSMRVKTSTTTTTTGLCLRFPSVFQPNSLFIYVAACLLTGSLCLSFLSSFFNWYASRAMHWHPIYISGMGPEVLAARYNKRQSTELRTRSTGSAICTRAQGNRDEVLARGSSLLLLLRASLNHLISIEWLLISSVSRQLLRRNP